MQFQSSLQVSRYEEHYHTKRFLPIDENTSKMEVEGIVTGPRFWANLVQKGKSQFEKKFVLMDEYFKNLKVVV